MSEYLYRVAKFEIVPNSEQLDAINVISENLKALWNMSVTARTEAYNTHLAPIYVQIHTAQNERRKDAVKKLKAQLKEAKQHPDVKNNANAFAQQKHILTPIRGQQPEFARVPRAWQNDCLVTLDASFKSYYQLKNRGDPKAKHPRAKDDGRFQEISSRDPKTFRLAPDMSSVTLPCKKVAANDVMTFPIPPYQQEQLRQGEAKKFTLYRSRDGRYWMSIAFAIPAPEALDHIAERLGGNVGFIALGTTSIGVLIPTDDGWIEGVVDVPRPDLHWKPRIDSVSARMRKLYRKDREQQSRRYNRMKNARRIMFETLRAQQQKSQREFVQRLLSMAGPRHFVVTELIVRSKQGKLADSKKSDRRGTLGKNWSSQNTGWLANMLAWLRIKTQEHGCSVKIFKVQPPHPRHGNFHDRKIAMVRLLRDQYLATQS